MTYSHGYRFSCIQCSWQGKDDELTYLLPPFGVGVGIPVCPRCGAEVTMAESGSNDPGRGETGQGVTERARQANQAPAHKPSTGP